MAEQSTQTDATAQAHSQTDGLNSSTEVTTITLSAEGDEITPSVSTTTAPDADVEDLRRQNERLRQQVNGWTTQSQKNLDERNALAERIARLEGSLSAQQPKETPAATQNRKLALKNALNKWVSGDDSEIDAVEELLSQGRSQPTNSQDVESAVTRHLQSLMSAGQALAWVGSRHGEMRNQLDPLYADIYENYEAYAQDPGYAILFPPDPKHNASIPSPDNSRQKTMDVRIVNDIAGRLKLERRTDSAVAQGRQEERRAASVGQVAGSTGQNSRSTSDRAVEAWDIMSSKEQAEIQNMIMSRAVPPGWPKTERGIAKKLYDLASPAEKQAMRQTQSAGRRGA